MSPVQFFARCFLYGGASGAMLSSFVSLVGTVVVIVSTPAFCPESFGPDRCRVSGRNGAGLAAYALVVAGAFSLISVGGHLAERSIPEA